MTSGDNALSGWIPFRIRAALKSGTTPAAAEPKSDATTVPTSAEREFAGRVDWCFLGDDTFTDPFFEQTIQRCWRRPFNQLFAHETSLDALLAWADAQPGIAPAAFIFHTSRCGSTLLAQMAAALPGTIVISEAPPIDHILRMRAPDDLRVGCLRALLSALGQPRRGDERHLFVKLDAWHVMNLELVQRAFPRVPCVFLYREPVAVIASQLRMPGVHMLPGMLDPSVIDLDLAAVLRLDPDEYTGRILAALYAAAVPHAVSGRVTLMNYADLPSAASSQVLAWCGLADSDDAHGRVQRVAQFDAKTPSLPYDATDRSVRPPINKRAIDLAARFVDPCYQQLESIRFGTADRIAAHHVE